MTGRNFVGLDNVNVRVPVVTDPRSFTARVPVSLEQCSASLRRLRDEGGGVGLLVDGGVVGEASGDEDLLVNNGLVAGNPVLCDRSSDVPLDRNVGGRDLDEPAPHPFKPNTYRVRSTPDVE